MTIIIRCFCPIVDARAYLPDVMIGTTASGRKEHTAIVFHIISPFIKQNHSEASLGNSDASEKTSWIIRQFKLDFGI